MESLLRLGEGFGRSGVAWGEEDGREVEVEWDVEEEVECTVDEEQVVDCGTDEEDNVKVSKGDIEVTEQRVALIVSVDESGGSLFRGEG